MEKYGKNSNGDLPVWGYIILLVIMTGLFVMAANYGVSRSLELRCQSHNTCDRYEVAK